MEVVSGAVIPENLFAPLAPAHSEDVAARWTRYAKDSAAVGHLVRRTPTMVSRPALSHPCTIASRGVRALLSFLQETTVQSCAS